MIVRYLLKGLLLPPAGNLLLILVGLLCWRRYPRFARALVALGVVSLWVLSTPWVAAHLVAPLERKYPVVSTGYQCDDVQAIVVLGGGTVKHAPEYGRGKSLKLRTLARVRYAATLAKRCNKPLLVSGGRVFGNEARSEADLMSGVLENEFGVAVQWRESRSRTTEENARYTSETLLNAGVKSIVLVTSAFHMPRAMQSFGNHGLTVVPAPTAVSSMPVGLGIPMDWLPNASALLASRHALHEYLGLFVYKVLY